MQTFNRGATIHFDVQFLADDGSPVSVSAATVYILYRQPNNQRANQTIALSESAGHWLATWDSRIARPGTVSGHARSSNPVPIYAKDFEFLLEANSANPI